MNEELQTRLLKYMDHLEQYAQQGGDFVAEQTPLLVQEFLAWEFWYHLAWGACMLVVSVAMWSACVMCLRAAKYAFKEDRDNLDGFMPFVLLAPIVGGIAALLFVSAFNGLASAAKVHMAPRVYLLEHIAEMAK